MFDVPQIITSGSGKPQMSCMTLIMYLNRVIGQGSKNYGLGGAISVVIFIITGALSMIVFKSMINTGDKPKKAKKVKGAAK
jgi:multiple sugar transport system permease protein